MNASAAVDESRGSRGSPGSRLTVQAWQNLLLSIMGVVVLGGAVAGVVLLNRTDDVSRELIDEIQPARVAAYQLQVAVRDQETAIRGYLIAADRQFLDTYNEGIRAERAAAEDTRRLLIDRADLVVDLAAIEQAVAGWRTSYADPLISAVTRGDSSATDSAAAQRGRAEFSGIRALFDTQNQRLTEARSDDIEQLDQIRGWRDRVLGTMVAAFFLTAILLAVLTRRAVTGPLAALAAACRRITEGNFGERITPRGPKDIRGIAVVVEGMRQRIVAELDTTRSARTLLAEQADELSAQAVELRRSNAELEQFAYVASHDLQEPLRKVASFCQLLEKRYGDKLDERGSEYIGFAVDGAKRMQVLINDLLTFSRVGRFNAVNAEVDLDAALDEALDNLSTAIEESGAQIVRSRRLPQVSGDPALLAVLWQNLIGNAVKFRHADLAPEVVIACEPGAGDRGGEWLFSVSDNGIGIAAEFVDKVFVLFQRLHSRDSYSGTGIGLALCKKIVEYHGGTIWIDTACTEGTRFRFTMPVTGSRP